MATEKRLIYANEALRMMRNSKADNPCTDTMRKGVWNVAHDCAISCVDACPTVDAVEVVHGQWGFTEYEYFDCSVCGESYYNGCDTSAEAREKLQNGDTYRFCPYCGAKMDGERKSDGEHT